ncbi:MAG: hypothetical protein Q9169_005279 [Polycauliona sp. 2 TL-2023]
MAAEYLKAHGINLQDENSSIQYPASGSHKYTDNSTSGVSNENEDQSGRRISRKKTSKIKNVKLTCQDPDTTWDVSIDNDIISSIDMHKTQPHDNVSSPQILNGNKGFLLPSLCHPHIHLDKCFLLSDPKYSDLSIQKGDFAEALSLTSKAKSRFTPDDLLRRGRWLVEESIAAGVTCMRAFVEVDATVRFKCLDAGLLLKQQYRDACFIQICVFAQDPLFSGESTEANRELMEEAVQREGVDAVGSTPYVEADEARMEENIDWVIDAAIKYGKHLDLHLDYNLDESKKPMVYHLIGSLQKREWPKRARNKTIMLGHCSRLTLLTSEEWSDLHHQIGDLPISFVGLPTSDLFMMGRPSEPKEGSARVRGTLQIPQMIEAYQLQGTFGVNNVGNAFTPQGNCDPLSLASMCVGIYQAGTKQDAELLYQCISTRARAAIGCGKRTALKFERGDEADLVLLNTNNNRGGRPKGSLEEIIYDPPTNRSVISTGHMLQIEKM